MRKLRSLGPLVRIADTRTTRLPPKTVEPIYNSPDFRAWRALVVAMPCLRPPMPDSVLDHFGGRAAVPSVPTVVLSDSVA